ncbi:MAG: glycosyltransferase family 39 protein [Anaerolineaceae bacterium]|nr:glycosyltransferase family 39 protein [Anaerolineaceae bacterium]
MRLKRNLCWIFLPVLTAAGLKAWLLWMDVVPFNSDEAIVALMARHILSGERPAFFYGQAYMGSLDAFLVAVGFLFFGSQVWVIRLVQGILYLLTIIATVLIGRVVFDSREVGLFSGLLLAIPTVNVALYTTASLGGYGEALLLGSLLLLISFWVKKALAKNPNLFSSFRGPLVLGLFGLLAGAGFWANGITLVFVIPAGLGVIAALIRSARGPISKRLEMFFLLVGAGFIAGSAPWWLALLDGGLEGLISELFGSAVAVEQGTFLTRTAQHLINLALLGGTVTFGMRPPWGVRWLALPLLPLVLIFWLGVVFYWIKGLFRRSDIQGSLWVLMGILFVVAAGFLFTSFGVDPSGRYFVPLALPLALVGAQFLHDVFSRKRTRFVALTVVLAFNLMGIIQCALRYPPGLTTQFYEATIIDHRYDQELIQFLEINHETRGYTNYWVAYPLAFLSNEDLIFIPRLPYHLDLRYTARDNRYLPYEEVVKTSPRNAYITTRNPTLDDYLREKFVEEGIEWREKRIGDYQIYYELSKALHPEDIGLGN